MTATRESLPAAPPPRLFGPVACLLLGLAFLAPLITAGFLTPDASGFGTHRQLLLPACGLRSLTGIPCPFCGMTTTFAMIAHGDVVRGVVHHPVGALLFALCGVVGLLLVGLALARRSLPDPRAAPWWRTVERAAVAAFVLGWVYQLARTF